MKIIEKIWLAATLLCVVPMARADALTVEVAGLSVQKPVSAKAQPGDPFSGPAVAEWMGGQSGTRLRVWVSVPGKTIIEADDKKSKFGSFTDDKGTNLFGTLGHEPDTFDLLDMMHTDVTDDGKYFSLDVGSGDVPAKGATKVMLAMTLALKCSGPLKTVQQAGVAVKNNSKITVGPVPLTISDIKPKGAGVKFKLTSHKNDNGATTKVAFFDAAGKEIPSSANNFETESGDGVGYTNSAIYSLARKVPVMTVKITYRTGMETVIIPIQVESGLSLK